MLLQNGWKLNVQSCLLMDNVQLPSRKAFLSAELQEKLEAEGYVKLNLLKENQVSSLLSVFEQQSNPELSYPFYTSNWSKDVAYRKKVDTEVRAFLEKPILELLDKYKCGLGYFLVKCSNPNSEFRVHQDWSMVDESKFTGLTLWVALSDTNVENGCFHIVKRSHLFSTHARGSAIESHFLGIKDEIESEYCMPIEMKKGEALVFDHRLWHFSPANLSSDDRIAAGMVLIPKETTFIHLYYDAQLNMVKTYKCNDDFLIENGFGDDVALKNYELLDEKPFVADSFDKKLFEKLFYRYNQQAAKPKRGLGGFIETLFG